MEGRTLEELDDATLLRSIDGLSLRVCFLTFLSNSVFVLYSYLSFSLGFLFQTMILEIESASREERHKAIFQKMEQNHSEYGNKNREICMWFC